MIDALETKPMFSEQEHIYNQFHTYYSCCTSKSGFFITQIKKQNRMKEPKQQKKRKNLQHYNIEHLVFYLNYVKQNMYGVESYISLNACNMFMSCNGIIHRLTDPLNTKTKNKEKKNNNNIFNSINIVLELVSLTVL